MTYAVEYLDSTSDIGAVNTFSHFDRLEVVFTAARKWHGIAKGSHPRICVYVQPEKRAITRDDCPDYTMSLMEGGYIKVADYRNELPAIVVARKAVEA
ncbi:hypothetical protein ACFZCK_14100 [Kitasatospora purpeofusca]|uniref:hypothetical protein n=1 Tax=Kitasatospora purpeofusca TaxID=67352 RepID=UPI0036E782B6